MLWVYVLLLTAGVVTIVPTLLRAVDDLPGDALTGAIGFGGLSSGVVGLILRFADVSALWTFLVAAGIGLVAAALHTELVDMLRPGTDHDSDRDHADDHVVSSDSGGFRIEKPKSKRSAT